MRLLCYGLSKLSEKHYQVLEIYKTILGERIFLNHSVQFSSVDQSCPTLCNPMNHSTLGLLDHHQLPELTQTHDHQVGDAIQPSHPLSSHSPPAFNLSQHHFNDLL